MKYLTAVLVVITIAGCSDTAKVVPNTVSIVAPKAEVPSQVSYNTSMNFSSAGLMRAILHAGRVQTFDARRYTLLDSAVRVDFFDKLGKHSSRLTSLTAKVNQNNNNMTAYGKVHIVADSGTIVDTDSLLWDNTTQKIHSDAAVRISEKNGRVTNGTGFDGDQSLTHYTITHPVIDAPAGTLQQPGSTAPRPPAIPGSVAFGTPQMQIKTAPMDTTKKSRDTNKK